MEELSRWTLIAVAVVAYALANVAHEGAGHGGACALFGGTPIALSAVSFECDKSQLSDAAAKGASAAGTLVNLLLASLAWGLRRRSRGLSAPSRIFWWLFFSINALQAAGYWLFSGLGNVGDWAVVAGGSVGWRVVLAVGGAAAYCGAIGLSLRWLAELVGDDPARLDRARSLTLVPYLAGGVLYVAAGLFNPHGFRLVLISAAAASLGGTSALAWMYHLLRNTERIPARGPALALPQARAWWVAGALVSLVFVAVLGPSVRF